MALNNNQLPVESQATTPIGIKAASSSVGTKKNHGRHAHRVRKKSQPAPTREKSGSKANNKEESKNLKNKIEDLIKWGYLKQFIKDERRLEDQGKEVPQASREQDAAPKNQQQERPVQGTINMITGGSIIAGCTTSASKNSIKEVEQEDSNPSKRPKREEVIYFTKDNMYGIQYPHDDALVIRLLINDFKVKRILVNSGSLGDILFLEDFERMELGKADLQPANVPLIDFNGEVVWLIDKVRVLEEAGSPLHTMRFDHEFLVVATPSPYNTILSPPILHTLRAIVLTYHLVVKFPTDTGIGVLRGD
ncbi:PREDICTED: uncharacterized protein LOC104601493 [Nelumbo nucifera]|uniref:Uncharacterized protein LOC104601493 n=1 Tax=Nelumbo nucifera TaxID=4432 RepID=A0A1U8ALD0_NELNU|nr:PREDICTED: uncharacterized protein LOC104601493 [Nelumbo nucifera]